MIFPVSETTVTTLAVKLELRTDRQKIHESEEWRSFTVTTAANCSSVFIARQHTDARY